MTGKLALLWSRLRANFWLVPSLIVGAAIALALVLLRADAGGAERWLPDWPLFFDASAEGARATLSTIAGSMMTVVGVTFSMTLVALALASSQYTSRVLRNFMSDRVTQVVLGIFTGVFAYCLVVLRSVRGSEAGGFVPHLSVTAGVVLAIGGVGVLILFIHHIASSIQAVNILARVARETRAAAERLFPDALDGAQDAPAPPPGPGEPGWHAIVAERSGYVQAVDRAALVRLARERDTLLRVEAGVGAFVVEGGPLVSLARREPLDPELVGALRSAWAIGRYRTVDQDVGFGIRQIVDIALRALSPGVNDTTTAVMAVDHLTTILARLAPRRMPVLHADEEGEPRLVTDGPTFPGLLSEAFDQIRASGEGNAAILLRLLDALDTLAARTGQPGRRAALRAQLEALREAAARALAAPHERARVEQRLALVEIP